MIEKKISKVFEIDIRWKWCFVVDSTHMTYLCNKSKSLFERMFYISEESQIMLPPTSSGVPETYFLFNRLVNVQPTQANPSKQRQIAPKIIKNVSPNKITRNHQIIKQCKPSDFQNNAKSPQNLNFLKEKSAKITKASESNYKTSILPISSRHSSTLCLNVTINCFLFGVFLWWRLL